jgi:hypothetical protein
LANHINDQAEQFESGNAQQQQQQTQDHGPDAIGAELPREREQPANQFPGGILFVAGGARVWSGRFQNLKMPQMKSAIELKIYERDEPCAETAAA